jgi:peptide/nickel transport system permease protein
MLIFAVRRFLSSIFVLLAASFIVFVFCAETYDPLQRFRVSQPPKSAEFFTNQRHILGLDRPVLVRYWDWLSHLIRFDFSSVAFIRFNFGNNINNAPVASQLATRLQVTARMVILAIICAVIIAVVLGVISGVRRDKPIDVAVTILTFMLIALPTFWFAAVIKEGAIQLNHHAGTHFATIGDISPGLDTYGTSSEIRKDQLIHLILPTVSLTLLTTSGWIRYQRASTVDVLEADYMRLARAKGVRWPTVIRRHGLRNALIPLVTIVAIDVGALFGGAIITEKVYVWHGMGEFLNTALANEDVNSVVGWVMVSAVFVVAFNFFADLLYAALDPRIRLA